MTGKKLNDIIVKKLYSDSISDSVQALSDIQQSGNSNYIPMLIDILQTSDEEELKNPIIKILSEVKHTDAVPQIVKAIEDNKYADIQEILIRTCWENGLDYTNYFTTFVNLLINGDYMVAFEAHTVIENTEGHLSETSALELISKLEDALDEASEDRKTLIQSIISFLPSIIKA